MLRLEPIRADALETGHGLEAIEVLKRGAPGLRVKTCFTSKEHQTSGYAVSHPMTQPVPSERREVKKLKGLCHDQSFLCLLAPCPDGAEL
jgi:hypothetical protein